MKKTISIIIVILVLGMLGYGLFSQKEVSSLNPQDVTTTPYSAYKTVEAVTYDGLINMDGKLYNTTSLLPAKMSVKDCKT